MRVQVSLDALTDRLWKKPLNMGQENMEPVEMECCRYDDEAPEKEDQSHGGMVKTKNGNGNRGEQVEGEKEKGVIDINLDEQ